MNDTIKYHDLTLCIHGKMEYFIDGTAYTLTDGDCLYMTPGTRRIRLTGDRPATYVSVNLFGPLLPSLSTTFFSQYLTPQIMQLLDLMRVAHTTHCDTKLLLLSQYLLCDLQQAQLSRQENPVVLKIKNYILHNIYCKLTVNDAISQVYLSKEYCQALFKQETGMSIITFINREKVELSKSLLACEHKLTTVAQMLGFEDYNYFSRVFKQHTGLSPLKYRQLILKAN